MLVLLLPLLLSPLLNQSLDGLAVSGEPVRGLPSAVRGPALRTIQMFRGDHCGLQQACVSCILEHYKKAAL